MIIGDHRDQVINNIADHAQQGLFNEKVEIDDPQMTSAEAWLSLINFGRIRLIGALADNLIAEPRCVECRLVQSRPPFCGLENLKPLSLKAQYYRIILISWIIPSSASWPKKIIVACLSSFKKPISKWAV